MFTLRENEKILKIVRQHGSAIVGSVFRAAALAGLVTFVFIEYDLDIFGYFWEVIIGAILIAAIIILYKIYIWRKNTLIITNQRVILNNRQSAFSRTVTELLYRDIFDISFKQAGFLAMINRYGKLIIKTPSGSEIAFDKVSSPASVVESINSIRLHMPTQSREPQRNTEDKKEDESSQF